MNAKNFKLGFISLSIVTFLYLLLAGILVLIVSLEYHVALTKLTLFLFYGSLAWTLFEYVTHRFLFHSPLMPRTLRRLFIHGRHHADTKDSSLMIARPLLTLSAAAIILLAIGFSPLAKGTFLSSMTGFTLGYVYYEWVHFAIHERDRLAFVPLFHWQVTNHLKHHHHPRVGCFGVTSPLWDWIFKTRFNTSDNFV